jgi:hypothetical protein
MFPTELGLPQSMPTSFPFLRWEISTILRKSAEIAARDFFWLLDWKKDLKWFGLSKIPVMRLGCDLSGWTKKEIVSGETSMRINRGRAST